MPPASIMSNVLNKLGSISVQSLEKAIVTAYGGKELYKLWMNNPDAKLNDLNRMNPITNPSVNQNYSIQEYVDTFFYNTSPPYTSMVYTATPSLSGTQKAKYRVPLNSDTTFSRVVDTVKGKVVKEYRLDDDGNVRFVWEYTLADYLTILD